MAKYLNAERLERNGWYLQRTVTYSTSATGGYGYTETLKPTDYPAAADVAEVVRCKECRYRENEQPGMVYCPNTVGGWVDENWFCAGGERE